MPPKESPRIIRPSGDGAESADRAAAVLDRMARQHPNGASLIDLVVQSGLAQPTVHRLLHAKAVRPFVSGNKTDATDARAIWRAVQQPGVKFVGLKSSAQQATLTLHRQLMVKMRTMQVNALLGLLYEFGATFAKGHKALFCEIEQAFVDLSAQLPQIVVDSLREQVTRITALSDDMASIEKRLTLQLKGDQDMRRVAHTPGVGLLTATAAIATMRQASAFKSGREFCAWLVLVPTQTGTGGKVRLGHISSAVKPTCFGRCRPSRRITNADIRVSGRRRRDKPAFHSSTNQPTKRKDMVSLCRVVRQ